MIACVYGSDTAKLAEPIVADLSRYARARGVDLGGITLERAQAASPSSLAEIDTLYVLPLDEHSQGEDAFRTLSATFPNAGIANPLPAHTLSSDRIRLNERLLERGVPIPEALVTDAPDEVLAFVRQYEHAVLRDLHAADSSGGMLVFCDENGTLVGETGGSRYVVELEPLGQARSLAHGVLSLPAPFLVQRMITRVGPHGKLSPAPVLRAFVVDDDVPYWIESYREQVQRPADFLLTVDSGASRRFLQVVSDEADKLARRVTKAVGCTTAAVDLIRADTGFVALDVVCDGPLRVIDRSFKQLPEFREAFDLDRYIVDALADSAS